MIEDKIKQAIREVPNFPNEGINFKDITPLFLNPSLSKEIVDTMADQVKDFGLTGIAGTESRGFLFGFALAQKLNLPFILIRKKGKLPAETFETSYNLEYGSATLEIHKDALCMNDKILVHDDLLATGGTAVASAELIEKCGAQVAGFSFIICLDFLNGEEKLKQFTKNILNLARY